MFNELSDPTNNLVKESGIIRHDYIAPFRKSNILIAIIHFSVAGAYIPEIIKPVVMIDNQAVAIGAKISFI